MMKLSRLLFFLLFGCLSAPALAQTSSKVVKASPAESVYKIKKGSSAGLAVVINIEDGYHINSNRPAEKFLIPTALKFESLPGFTISKIIYPKAKSQKFEFSNVPMSVFEGKTIVKFTARALPSMATGQKTLKAKLTVQACNDQACLRPQTINIDIPIEVM